MPNAEIHFEASRGSPSREREREGDDGGYGRPAYSVIGAAHDDGGRYIDVKFVDSRDRRTRDDVGHFADEAAFELAALLVASRGYARPGEEAGDEGLGEPDRDDALGLPREPHQPREVPTMALGRPELARSRLDRVQAEHIAERIPSRLTESRDYACIHVASRPVTIVPRGRGRKACPSQKPGFPLPKPVLSS